MTARVVSVEDCGHPSFRWITLKKIKWEDPYGHERVWESAERTTRRGEVDGAAIVAKILRKGQPPVIPVLKQYRPPIASYCLELPAGLIDGSETAAEAAVRELKEETGYIGRVQEVTPVCVSDPGMSNANMQYVVLEVDGDAPENADAKQELDDGEFIEVELVPWAGLMQHLLAEMAATGCSVDARLLSYAWGLEHAKDAAALAVAAAAAAATAAAAAPTEGGAAPCSTAVEAPPAAPSLGIAIPGALQQPAQQRGPSSDVSLLLLGQRSGSSSSTTVSQPETSTGSAPPLLPFGSPILSAALSAGLGPRGSDGSSGGEQQPLEAQGSSPTAGEVAVSAAGTAASSVATMQQHAQLTESSSNSSGAGSKGSSSGRWQSACALLGVGGGGSGSWLLFAAGVVTGAAGCSLLMLAGGGSGSRPAAAR